MKKTGKAFLVGAGPGDPGLITVKGKNILKSADVVVYDSLINPILLKMCRENAELIYVGKKIGHKELSQNEINKLLVKKAKEGKMVLRLKGGDPFVFGRGGEEAEILEKNNIETDIVPGISSIIAVPAYSGVPVTHRDYNSSFAVFTAHKSKFNSLKDFDPASLKSIKTLVFLMGLNNIRNIMSKLTESGKDPETPVLVISNGTLPSQNSLVGTISNITNKLKDNPAITTPATIIVGDIINLRNKINWFENKPLFGKTVVSTRDKNYSSEIESILNQNGANVINFPTIEIKPIKNNKKLAKSIKDFDEYNFVIFTSVNGVKYLFENLKNLKKDSRIFGNKKIITIGEKTAAELKRYGLESDYTPDEYIAEGVIELCKKIGVKNKKVLIPRAKVAREILPQKLKELGAKVDVVATYETILPKHKKKDIDEIINKLKKGEINIVTFTSSSTARNFFELIGKRKTIYTKTRFACIGPITADTVKSFGFKSDIVAEKYTIEGLAQGIIDFYTK